MPQPCHNWISTHYHYLVLSNRNIRHIITIIDAILPNFRLLLEFKSLLLRQQQRRPERGVFVVAMRDLNGAAVNDSAVRCQSREEGLLHSPIDQWILHLIERNAFSSRPCGTPGRKRRKESIFALAGHALLRKNAPRAAQVALLRITLGGAAAPPNHPGASVPQPRHDDSIKRCISGACSAIRTGWRIFSLNALIPDQRSVFIGAGFRRKTGSGMTGFRIVWA